MHLGFVVVRDSYGKKPLKIHEGMCLSEDGATWTGTMSLKDLLLVSCYIG